MSKIAKGTFLTKERPVHGAEVKAGFVFHAATEAELKAIGTDLPDGYVAGWASTSTRDHYDHVVEPGAFSESIAEKGLTGPTGIKFLHGHDRDKVIGVIKVLDQRGDRLWIEAQLNLNVSYVKDLYETLKMVGGMSFSVGFFLVDYAWEINHETKDEYLRIKKGDLFEVSIVPFPGNSDCTMEFVKNRETLPTTLAQFEKALVATGLFKTRVEANKHTMLIKACYKLFAPKEKEAPVAPDPEPTDTGPVLDANQATEIQKHLAAIKAVLAAR